MTASTINYKKPSVFISRITFSGGGDFLLSPSDKIIIVGANNSGKSQALREIHSICKNGKKERPLVVNEIDLQKSSSETDLRDFLEAEGEYANGTYRFQDWTVPEIALRQWRHPYLTGGLLDGFIRKIAADGRLQICEQQASISAADQKSKPQHILYDDCELMAKISGIFRKAFGADLMFDFRGGSRLPIHVGDVPTGAELVDRAGDKYVKSVRANPLLDKQGDGMKSYAGILFEAIVANRDITLIDEPEAFLHPPQMRRLGETLSSEVLGQLFVATHSSDVMRGFLEGTRGSIRILRVRREGNQNIVSEAPPKIVKELWDKPELRYSNALEGIFHEQTIICEDDSDCRLINSVAEHLASRSDEQWRDTAYVPTGGKHGVPKVASVLRQVGTPVKAIFDIDFLAERELIHSTVEAFGGSWSDIEPIWRRVDAAVRSGTKPKTPKEVRSTLISILQEGNENDELPKSKILEEIKQTKPWANVKKFGSSAIPNGDAQNLYSDLRDALKRLGIYIVPVGEIENFCPHIGGHGPSFVTNLLSTVALDDCRLRGLREFVMEAHSGEHAPLT